MARYYEMHYKDRMDFGNADRIVIAEDKLDDDDTIKRFLVTMLLSNEWGDDFNNTYVEYDDESVAYHISDYLHQIKLLRISKNPEYVYEVSVRGRKYLDQQQGEPNDQQNHNHSISR